MKLAIKKGTTSKRVKVFIQDWTSPSGGGLTGLVYNSAGLTAYCIKDNESSATAITLATMTLGTWASGGFVEVDATNMPGVYELGIPDTCLATADDTVIMLKGATNMVPVPLEIQLVSYDPNDGDRMGMSDILQNYNAILSNLALISTVDSVVDAIKAVTDNLPDSGALSTIDAVVDAIKAKTDNLTFSAGTSVDSNPQYIKDDSTAADTLSISARAIKTGTVSAGSHTTSLVAASDLTGLTTDALKFRVINFVTGSNAGRSAPITAYNGTTGAITLDTGYPLPVTPSTNDIFSIT